MKAVKSLSLFLFLLILGLVLAGPAYADQHRGRGWSADIAGQIDVTRADGSEQSIDYSGRLRAAVRPG